MSYSRCGEHAEVQVLCFQNSHFPNGSQARSLAYLAGVRGRGRRHGAIGGVVQQQTFQRAGNLLLHLCNLPLESLNFFISTLQLLAHSLQLLFVGSQLNTLRLYLVSVALQDLWEVGEREDGEWVEATNQGF